MAKFKNEKGLTLIELLITISVLAVVSAIALPVINNVVAASNSNAYNQTIADADAFIDKYSKSGVVAYDGLTKTFSGYVDTDGDNQIDSNELVDTLTLDGKYSATATGSATVGGSYTTGGVTAVTIADSTSSAPVAVPFATGNFNNWNNPVYLASYNNYPTYSGADVTRFMIQRYGYSGTFEVGDKITITNAYIAPTGDATLDAYLAANQSAFNGTWTIVSKSNSMGDIYYLTNSTATQAIAQYLVDNGYTGLSLRGDWSATH